MATNVRRSGAAAARMPASQRGSLRPWLAGGVLALALIGALAAGYWGLVASRGHEGTPEEQAAIGEIVAVPGGQMRIEGVAPELIQHGTMAGMSMPDPVPDGYRRFSVDVTLLALSEGGLSYSPGSFTISGEGVEAAGPHRAAVAPGVVPQNMRMSMSMVFQAPEDADHIWLTFKGADRRVLLEGDLGDADHDH